MKTLNYILLLFTLAGCYSRSSEKSGLEGKVIPSFDLLLSDSTTYFNTSTIPSGKPIVFVYFSPRCPFSHAQIKEITQEIDGLKDIRFYFCTPFSLIEMNNFYKNYHLDKYSNITTGRDFNNFLGQYFQVKGVPYIAIYGKDKKLKESFTGKLATSHFRDFIEN